MVFLYKSQDLVNWEYIHPLYEGKKGQGWCFECPNFFPLGDKHILIVSPFGKVIYSIGIYKNYKFEPKSWKYLDYGRNFYATNILVDDKERTVLFGWVKKGGGEWCGNISLPRILSLREDNTLEMRSAPELQQLRKNHQIFEKIKIEPLNHLKIENIENSCYEIIADIELIGAGSFLMFLSPEIIIEYKNKELKIGKEIAYITSQKNENKVILHIFFDKSILEIYINYTECFTARIYPKTKETPDFTIKVISSYLNLKKLEFWELNSI